jgi:predicted RND superfamily exporter protein
LAEGRAIFGPSYSLTPTGSFYQMNQDSNRLVADMVKSFSLSIGLVLLSILILLRSLRLTLLAMIPNVIPILWTLGLMGFCGIDLSTGTAMIGAVVIGLAVDDTIHYLVYYRRVYTGVPSMAVIATTTRIGRALMIASLVLAVGFWVGCFSSFKPTIYFSMLVGGTLIGALLCDLLVLPACLVLNCPTRKDVR